MDFFSPHGYFDQNKIVQFAKMGLMPSPQLRRELERDLGWGQGCFGGMPGMAAQQSNRRWSRRLSKDTAPQLQMHTPSQVWGTTVPGWGWLFGAAMPQMTPWTAPQLSQHSSPSTAPFVPEDEDITLRLSEDDMSAGSCDDSVKDTMRRDALPQAPYQKEQQREEPPATRNSTRRTRTDWKNVNRSYKEPSRRGHPTDTGMKWSYWQRPERNFVLLRRDHWHRRDRHSHPGENRLRGNGASSSTSRRRDWRGGYHDDCESLRRRRSRDLVHRAQNSETEGASGPSDTQDVSLTVTSAHELALQSRSNSQEPTRRRTRPTRWSTPPGKELVRAQQVTPINVVDFPLPIDVADIPLPPEPSPRTEAKKKRRALEVEAASPNRVTPADWVKLSPDKSIVRVQPLNITSSPRTPESARGTVRRFVLTEATAADYTKSPVKTNVFGRSGQFKEAPVPALSPRTKTVDMDVDRRVPDVHSSSEPSVENRLSERPSHEKKLAQSPRTRKSSYSESKIIEDERVPCITEVPGCTGPLPENNLLHTFSRSTCSDSKTIVTKRLPSPADEPGSSRQLSDDSPVVPKKQRPLSREFKGLEIKFSTWKSVSEYSSEIEISQSPKTRFPCSESRNYGDLTPSPKLFKVYRAKPSPETKSAQPLETNKPITRANSSKKTDPVKESPRTPKVLRSSKKLVNSDQKASEKRSTPQKPSECAPDLHSKGHESPRKNGAVRKIYSEASPSKSPRSVGVPAEAADDGKGPVVFLELLPDQRIQQILLSAEREDADGVSGGSSRRAEVVPISSPDVRKRLHSGSGSPKELKSSTKKQTCATIFPRSPNQELVKRELFTESVKESHVIKADYPTAREDDKAARKRRSRRPRLGMPPRKASKPDETSRGRKVFAFCPVLGENVERHPIQSKIPVEKWWKWLHPRQLKYLATKMLENPGLCLNFSKDADCPGDWEILWQKWALHLNSLCYCKLTRLNTGLRLTVDEWKTLWLTYRQNLCNIIDSMNAKERVHNLSMLECLLLSEDLYKTVKESKGACLGEGCPRKWCVGSCKSIGPYIG